MSSIKDAHDHEPKLPPWSRKSLFVKSKPSEEWHRQIDFTAGGRRPSEQNFQWDLVKRHTDHYIKKKGKMNKTDIDVKLAYLIEQHEARDVAIAACAHAMSPKAVQAILNVELNVAPTTFFGLEMYLQCLIAANRCSPVSVTDLEARWATELLPYAEHGASAAGRYLEGICVMLRKSNTPNMNGLPDFSILARRAFKTFATQLEGMKLRFQWVAAYNAAMWMKSLVQSTPAVTASGNLMPEHLMSAQFPLWRIWARWRPDKTRIVRLETIDAMKRAVLVDIMALEGPDFINGTEETLREGIIKHYATRKPFVRFRSLILEMEKGTREELREILERTSASLERALTGGDEPFKLFVQLAITRPINREGLQLLEAVGRFQDTPTFPIYNATLEVYTAQSNIGGRHTTALTHMICAMDDPRGEEMKKLILRPWFVQGIDKCIKECQAAVRTHIDTGLAWKSLALEFHEFLATVKGSQSCLLLMDPEVQRQLEVLPPVETMQMLFEIYAASEEEHAKVADSGTNVLKTAIAAWFVDRLIERGTLNPASKKTVDAILHIWNGTTTRVDANLERRSLALLASQHTGVDLTLRIRCFDQILRLPVDFVAGLLPLLRKFWEYPERSVIDIVNLLTKADGEMAFCWKDILYKLIEGLQPEALIEYVLKNMDVRQYLALMLDIKSLFKDSITNSTESPPKAGVQSPQSASRVDSASNVLEYRLTNPNRDAECTQPWILRPQVHECVRRISPFQPALLRLECALGDHSQAVEAILRGGEGLWVEYLVLILEGLTTACEMPVEKLMQKAVSELGKDRKNAATIANFTRQLLAVKPEGLEICERIWDAKHGVDIVSAMSGIRHIF
jgi:hypothetical protein